VSETHTLSHSQFLWFLLITLGAVSQFLFTAGKLKLKSVSRLFYFSISKAQTLTVASGSKHHRTSGSARGDRASTAGPRSGRSTSRVASARGHRRGANTVRLRTWRSVHDRPARRVETARISLKVKRTPRFRLARRRAQNGTCPGYRAILHGECALGVLKDLFWFPGRFMCIGSRTPAKGAHPSAMEAPGARNADLFQ
jgi:hypothetical protein